MESRYELNSVGSVVGGVVLWAGLVRKSITLVLDRDDHETGIFTNAFSRKLGWWKIGLKISKKSYNVTSLANDLSGSFWWWDWSGASLCVTGSVQKSLCFVFFLLIKQCDAFTKFHGNTTRTYPFFWSSALLLFWLPIEFTFGIRKIGSFEISFSVSGDFLS